MTKEALKAKLDEIMRLTNDYKKPCNQKIDAIKRVLYKK